MSTSILIVDDDHLNRQVVLRRLTREGYAVAMAASGPMALEMLERQRFDLVLLDVELPAMDGLETLKRIRANPSWNDVPVIMLSGHCEPKWVAGCMAHGAADYLIKPLVMPLVRARIERCLQHRNPRPSETATPSTAGAHILVVDDDGLSCRLMTRQLKNYGCTASSVTSGEAALERLARESFDLVLLDINMPNMSGSELLRKIRSDDKTNRLPVIMVTAVTDLDTMLTCIDQGADGYVTKPVDMEYLNNCIRSSLEIKKAGAWFGLGATG